MGLDKDTRRIDAFKLWSWKRLFRVPWTVRRSNQSSLKEINPENSLEGLMLKLKLQYIGQLMLRANSLEKTLILGKIEGRTAFFCPLRVKCILTGVTSPIPTFQKRT